MKETHWINAVSEETLRHVLKTVHYILDDADKELTELELNKLHYCWDIIEHIYHFEISNLSNHNNSSLDTVNSSVSLINAVK